MNRRAFLKHVGVGAVGAVTIPAVWTRGQVTGPAAVKQPNVAKPALLSGSDEGSAMSGVERPNVILVLTDDQGYGDLSSHGNPVLMTPNLDKLRGESIRFTDFHVAPMCTPTRGQLMSGLDALRNRARHVCGGLTMLRSDVPTMGEIFNASGYQTGIFGKWHL